jgi:hypothetical protein
MTKKQNSAHHTVITNLQKQLEDKRSEYNRRMAEYSYRKMIKQIVDERLGPEPNYIYSL